MRALLITASISLLLASPLAAQSVQAARIDSLQTELGRADAFQKASQTQLEKTRLLLNRYRNVMVPAESGRWTFVMPVEHRWRAVATVPADSGWATIVLDSAGIVRDSARVWMGARQ